MALMRKDVRDAFLRGETNSPNPPIQKSDPSLRERERNKENASVFSAQSAVSASSAKSSQSKDADNYVGFANLPNQVFRKSVKKGFEFTLMVVGESGLGKSTLVNSMFLTDLYCSEYPGPTHRSKKTVQVDKTHVQIKENGVQLRLTVVDTPGFGDAVDNSTSWQPITEYIEKQYSEYLNNESRVYREPLPDTRVHACLYFISPNGHGLKALDIEIMKQLHDKVNIIPLIAKADTLTVDECRDFKKTILNEIERNNIHIYEFPDYDEDDDNTLLKKLKDRVPFAVVGSNNVIESQGKKKKVPTATLR